MIFKDRKHGRKWRKCWLPAVFSFFNTVFIWLKFEKDGQLVLDEIFVLSLWQIIKTVDLSKFKPVAVDKMECDVTFTRWQNYCLLQTESICRRHIRYNSNIEIWCLTHYQTKNFRLKEFADDNFKFDESGRKLSKRVENTVGKGEIARYVWEWVKDIKHGGK